MIIMLLSEVTRALLLAITELRLLFVLVLAVYRNRICKAVIVT